MTCHEYHRGWNELLDAEAGGRESANPAAIDGPRMPALRDAEDRLLAHAAECPACRPIAARYETLRQAIRSWRRPPVPSPGLVQSILSTPVSPAPSPWTTRVAEGARRSWRAPQTRRRLVVYGGLAATWVLGLLLLRTLDGKGRGGQPSREPIAREEVARDLHSIDSSKGSVALDRVLAEATSATWDLARSASEPAARIGRDVLDAGGSAGDGPADAATAPSLDPGEGLARLTLPVPSLDPLASESMTGSAVIRQFGDRLSAGVAPISSTARHAFGFLLGPPRSRDESNDGRSTPTGAQSG